MSTSHSETHHDAHGAQAGGHGHGSPHPPIFYIRIWGILLVLLTISVLGPMLEITVLTLVTAFGIAFVKAYLVAKNFMHLDVERPIVCYALTTSLAFMVLFFSAVAPDVMEHEGTRWENVAAKNEIARFLAAGDVNTHGEHGAAAEHDAAPEHGEHGEHGSAPAAPSH